MANFKPGCWLRNERGEKLEWRSFVTYKELKKNIRSLIEENREDNEVTVFRSRRAEWGEWFEKWAIVDGKPKITKQGWM